MEVKKYLAQYFTYLITFLTLAGILFFGYDFYTDKQYEKEQRALLEERYGRIIGVKDDFTQISTTLAQLSTLYLEQAALTKEILTEFKDVQKDHEERYKSFTRQIVSVEGKTTKQIGPDLLQENEEGEFIVNEIKVDGVNSPPIGAVLIKRNGETEKTTYDFDVHVDSVQVKDDFTGKIKVVSKAYLVSKTEGVVAQAKGRPPKWVGFKYPLQVTGGSILVDPIEPMTPSNTQPAFLPWTLNLNVGFGIFSQDKTSVGARPTIGLNLAGYGVNKRDLKWKFAHLGVNYTEVGGIGFHMTPFSYRVMPEVLTNTYVGPGWSVNNEIQSYFLGVDVSL